MAITDGLVSRIYAETGDATLTDKIQSLSMSGSGTASIVDVGGEDAWNLSGAAYTLTVPNKVMDFATDGVQNQGITIAMRYRINTFGSTGGYNRIIGGLLSDGTTKFTQLSKEGANVAGYWTTVRPIANLSAQTTAVTHTIVFVVKSNTAGGWKDHLKAWRNTVGRVGTDANYSGETTGALITFGGLFVNAPDTMNYDLFDLVYWDRELTDAEAAAVADDLRTQLPLGGGADTYSIRAGIADPLLSAVAIAAAGLGVNQTVEVVSPSLNVVNPFNNLRPMEGKGGDESTDWSLGSIYEPIRKRVYHSAAPAGYNFNEHAGSGLTIYDVETNLWRRIQNPLDWALSHAYDAQAIDEQGIYYRNPINFGLVHRWDTNTEMKLPYIPAPDDTISGAGGSWSWSGVGSIGFHPKLGAQGSLILQNSTRSARWDKATETWSTLIDKYTSAVDEYPYCHYNPTSEILVTGNEGATGSAFLVDGSGTITSSSPNPQTIMVGGPPTNNLSLFLPAPNSTKSLLFCPIDSKIYALDTLTGVWDAGINMPTSMTDNSHKMLTSKIAATLHEFNCILIANYGGSGTSQMHLYRYN